MSSHAWKHRFVPRLEVCERRDCPAVSAVINGGVLTVTGNGDGDTVQITFDDGQVEATISDDSGSRTARGAVSAINVNTKGGSDTVEFDALDPIDVGLAISVKLGGGNDSFSADLGGGVEDAAVTVNVTGGGGTEDVELTLGDVSNGRVFFDATLSGGNDNFDADVGGDIDNASEVRLSASGSGGADSLAVAADADVDAGSRLSIDLTGGGGNDRIDLSSGGNVAGLFLANVSGGGGKDTIDADVDNGDDDGQITLDVNAGGGSDTITIDVDTDGFILATLNAGGGKDTATVDGNVVVSGVENLNLD